MTTQEQKVNALIRAIPLLPENERWIVELYIKDKSVSYIASVTAMHPTSVRRVYARAVKRINSIVNL